MRGGGAETVFDCLFGLLRAVEDAVGDEIKQLVIAREMEFERALEVRALEIGA